MYKAIVPYESFEKRGVTLELDIPDKNLVAVAIPRMPPAIKDVEAETLRAVENPVAGPKFSDLLRPGRRVTIIVDNQFRPTPAHLMLPPLLDMIEDSGAEATLIFACGCVPPLNDKEFEEKVGRKVVDRLGRERIFNNEARKTEDYVF